MSGNANGADNQTPEAASDEPALTQDDVLAAMGDIPGYLDIGVNDFLLLHRLALRYARKRLQESKFDDPIDNS